MSNLTPRNVSLVPPLHLLEHPSALPPLVVNNDRRLEEFAAILELVLKAPQRCQLTSFYIQAVATQWAKFLTTNVAAQPVTEITPIASSWLIGRSSNCVIAIQHKTVSRRHAILGHDSATGFYIIDLGSSNGTWVNYHRLVPTERQSLQDGDIIQFGKLQVEFFLATPGGHSSNVEATTYH